MIEYQTGLQLPTIRLHGLYTQVRHRDVWADATRGKQLLVLKGPNICLDSATGRELARECPVVGLCPKVLG